MKKQSKKVDNYITIGDKMPREKQRKHWERFANEILKKGIRYDNFDKAYQATQPKTCGQYRNEAGALWRTLKKHKIQSMAEVGRNLGGGLFILACACPDLKRVTSVDIASVPEIDEGLKIWFDKQGIEFDCVTMPSADYKPQGIYDFTYIDGEHTGEGVKKDIEIWENHTGLIGFHDYADKGHNKHRRYFPEVVDEIRKAKERNKWYMCSDRARSEVIFATKYLTNLEGEWHGVYSW